MAYRSQARGRGRPRRGAALPAAARRARLYLVAVGVEKPGNLGAIARSAEAAGADALLVAEASADPFNPNAIRASTGAVFTLPVVEVEPRAGARASVSRSSPRWSGRDAAPAEVDLARPVAIAVGAEDRGLPEHWRAAAADEVSIPIAAGATAESLNASVAAADPPLRGGAPACLAATTSSAPARSSSATCARTPLLSSRTLGARLKCELFQRTGSFKARGAIAKLASLDAAGARRAA